GLRVLVCERRQLPLVSGVLAVEQGASADPAGEEGLAVLTARLLSEGAGARSAAQLADEIDTLGVSLDNTAGWDSSLIRLRGLEQNLDDVMALVADMVLRPRFEEAEFDREQKLRLAEILSDRDDPRSISVERTARFVYGAHRYGTQLAGDDASVGRLTPERVRAQHAESFFAGAAFLVLVGDIDAGRGLELAARHLGEWRAGKAELVVPPTPTPTPLPATVLHLIDKPGAAQSEVRIAQPGVARSHPD